MYSISAATVAVAAGSLFLFDGINIAMGLIARQFKKATTMVRSRKNCS